MCRTIFKEISKKGVGKWLFFVLISEGYFIWKFFQWWRFRSPLADIITLKLKNISKTFLKKIFKGINFCYLWLLLSPYKKIFFWKVRCEATFRCYFKFEQKNNVEKFFEKFFETTQIMVGLAVMMAVEIWIKKIFVHFLRFGCQIWFNKIRKTKFYHLVRFEPSKC